MAFKNKKEKMTSAPPKPLFKTQKPQNHLTCDKKKKTMISKNLVQRLQQISKAYKDKNVTMFQSTLDTKKCIKVFMTQPATCEHNQDLPQKHFIGR
jgi:hypothetical protein